MGISEHIWGVSHEQDVVWSQVCGLDPVRADRRLLMIWQGYFDETEKDGLFVIAGYLARVDRWAAFSAEWAAMARRYGKVDDKGRWYFHMAEQSMRADLEYLPRLRDIIADTVLMGFAQAIRPADYRNALSRLIAFKGDGTTKLTGNLTRNYFLFAFDAFLDNLSGRIQQREPYFDQINIAAGDRLDFFFDQRGEKKIIDAAWEDFRRVKGENNVLTSPPRFEDDKEFLPLQAADFLAYWLRQSLKDAKKVADLQSVRVFPFMRTRSRPKRIYHYVVLPDEEDIVKRWESWEAHDGVRLVDSRKIVKSEQRYTGPRWGGDGA